MGKEKRRYVVRVEYVIEHDEENCSDAIRSASYFIPENARDLRVGVIHAKRIESKPEPNSVHKQNQGQEVMPPQRMAVGDDNSLEVLPRTEIPL